MTAAAHATPARMAMDILFFDEFFLLPVYAVIGAGYAGAGNKI